MIKDLIENFIQRWQAKCPHDEKYVRNDLLGFSPGASVAWCYRCGAISVLKYGGGGITNDNLWKQPKAAWATRAGT